MKQGIILLLVVWLAAGAVGAQTTCQRGVDYLARGDAAFADSDLNAALENYGCAAQLAPDNPAARLARAKALVALGDTRNAMEDARYVVEHAPLMLEDGIHEFSAAIDASPDNITAYVLRSYYRWLLAQDDAALADYDRILELDAANHYPVYQAYAHLFRASSNQYLGNIETVADDVTRALQLSRDDAGVYMLMAETYHDTGALDAALAAANAAIGIVPRAPFAFRTRADIHLSRGDYAAAEADYTRAIQIAPDMAALWESRARLYFDQGRYHDALADFDSALNRDDGLASAYLWRAMAKERIGTAASGAADMLRYAEAIAEDEASGTPLTVESATVVRMSRGAVRRIPFAAEAGQHYTINVAAADSSVDPVVILLAPDGTPLLASSSSPTATLEWDAPESGDYMLVVTHGLGGTDGRVEVELSEGD